MHGSSKQIQGQVTFILASDTSELVVDLVSTHSTCALLRLYYIYIYIYIYIYMTEYEHDELCILFV